MRLIRLMKHDLAREISGWVDQSLISDAQADEICKLYDVDYRESKNKSWGYRVLVLLGYLFIGLAVITLLGANWDEIPRSVRMVGLIALTMGTHSIGLKHFFAGRESSAVGVFFLGNLFFGASIVLICQIYHLGETIPDEIFWWALGTLPFGMILKNHWLSLMTSVLALIWFFLETEAGFFPYAYLIFAGSAAYVLIANKKSSSLLFLTAVGGFLLWIEAGFSYLWTGLDEVAPEQVFVTAGIFILLSVVSRWLGTGAPRAKDYGALLSMWVLRFVIFSLVVLSFAAPWGELLDARWEHPFEMLVVYATLVGAAAYLASRVDALKTALTLISVTTLVMFLVVVVGDPDLAVVLQVITNISLIVGGVYLILRGIDGGVSHYFFVGVSTILITALMRYIDLIGDYIGGAILFAFFAAVLLGSAKVWRNALKPEVSHDA